VKIAITSGKGGVGKTFAATCLAAVMAQTQPVRYIDCDVEAPNAHLFLKPETSRSQPQTLACIEGMDPDKCTHCGRCAKACYFNALIVGKQNAMAFPELCRWCGACQIVCPNDALIVGQRPIGTIYQGRIGHIDLHWATLQAGAGGMTVRLIEQIKQAGDNVLTILDSPPGTSCAVVNTINDADIVVLVSDPTRFGRHDLMLSVHLCRAMGIQPLVLINRAGIGDLDGLRRWCKAENLPILGEIPDDRSIAECYSRGLLPSEHLDSVKELFADIAGKLRALPKPANTKPSATNNTKNESIFFDTHHLSATPTQTESTASPVEITIVSGKGGTGKTSLAACFAQLARTVVADCDVDAADMHLLLEPQVIQAEPFIGGRVMAIDPRACTVCGQCVDICQWNAITKTNNTVAVHPDRCEGCGACMEICPVDAVHSTPTRDGRWYWSAVRCGRMSHATLEPGRENSGKLVTLVRKNAAQKNTASDESIIILDGSPGTGCPVIASVGGAKAAVIVTEPTVSGLHDLLRILELTEHFNIPAGIIVNKADINTQVTDQILQLAAKRGARLLGQLPYDPVFLDAQQSGKTVLEYQPTGRCSMHIQNIWNNIKIMTGKNKDE
jgi:MinD superfamily P-loop ATPase